MASSSATKQPDTQIIKTSIAYRAKYRLGQGPEPTIMMMAPGLAVPHPKNRGGDPVVSLRTKQLAGFIANAGFDAVEVKSCAIAVKDDATRGGGGSTRGGGVGPSFQASFEAQTANDPDMAKQIGGLDACIGTLSHSHLNCVLRNIQAGMHGCVCGVPEGACACEPTLKAFLSQDGHYELDALRRVDNAWAALIDTGVPSEVLSSQMEIEEPEAALTISIALNKKNEAAMETGHDQEPATTDEYNMQDRKTKEASSSRAYRTELRCARASSRARRASIRSVAVGPATGASGRFAFSRSQCLMNRTSLASACRLANVAACSFLPFGGVGTVTSSEGGGVASFSGPTSVATRRPSTMAVAPSVAMAGSVAASGAGWRAVRRRMCSGGGNASRQRWRTYAPSLS